MDVGYQPELLENPNGVPVEINFVPTQTMPSRNRVGVMVVMPPISETHHGHPPIVGGGIAGLEAARPPNMRGGVDDPGRMKPHNGAKENAPQHQAKATDSEQHKSEDSCWQKVVLCEPDMKFVHGQIGDVAFECWNVLAQGIASQDPPSVRPPLPI